MIMFLDVVNMVSLVLNVVGVLIILFGAALAVTAFVRQELFAKGELTKVNETIRIRLGSYLVFGLEFFIAGDIVKTVITPTWTGLGMLGAIVIIRTILSFFLSRDLRAAR